LEFALVIVPLLLVLGGIINFGYAFAQQIELDNAAREAARHAVVDTGGDGCAAAEQAAQDAIFFTGAVLSALDSPGGCPRPCEGATPGDNTVMATLNFTSEPFIALPLPTFGFPGFGDVAMRGEGVFRCEYQ
jgi:hypothetical protein